MKCIVTIYEIELFELIQFFSSIEKFWEIERTKQVTDQELFINSGEIVLDDNNQERKSWPVPDI